MTLCPEEIRTTNRRAFLKELHASPLWKSLRKAFLDDKGWICEWCGAGPKNLQVHHPFRSGYGSIELYLDFYKSECMILCTKCHTATEKGLVLCTYEGGKYHTDGENHYRHHDAKRCGVCKDALNPEIKEQKEIEAAKWRKIKRDINKKKSADANKRKADANKEYKKNHPVIKKRVKPNPVTGDTLSPPSQSRESTTRSY